MADCGDLLATKHGSRVVIDRTVVERAHDALDHVLQDFAERDWRARGSYEFDIGFGDDACKGDLRIMLFERPDHDAYPEIEDMR